MIAERPKITEYNGQKVSYLQEKYNGMFVQIERLRSVNVYTRTPGVDLWKESLHHLWSPQLTELILSIPMKTSIFAELYWDGPATAIKTKFLEGSNELKLCAFAMPWNAGKNFADTPLLSVMVTLNRMGFNTPSTTALPHNTIVNVKKYKNLALSRKIEGYVAKRSHMEGWYKIKPTRTMDCVVMSTNRSWAVTTFGEVQSLNVGVFKNGKLKQIARVGTGFSAKERAGLSRSDVGRVCEVKYQDIAQRGALQFPRFLRWRDDKPVEECMI